MKNAPIIGIDLGTTNSEVAIVQDGKVIVIAAEGNKILPSAVGLAQDGSLLVGATAKNQHVIYPERTVLSIKRQMGSAEKTLLGETQYTPQEISAIILKRLKIMAETYLQCPVNKAVITVPAYFSDVQRQATREAGELAGLEVVRIINEPTAASLAYQKQVDQQKRVLVYDLGGGTFDVSIVSLHDEVVEVLASGGNNHLGGDDFDAKIIAHINHYLQEQGVTDAGNSLQAQARIRRAAEAAKIALSDHPFALIEEEYLLEHAGKPYHLSLELTRDDYEEMIKSYIDESLHSVQQALRDASLLPSDIDEILLVGGSTRTPIIAQRLTQIFDKLPHAEIDPDLCVAIGAAIQAGIIAGEKCNTVLIDITPYTFGTSYLGILNHSVYPYIYKPVIQKNTPIPVSKSEVFETLTDEQERVEVKIYQGENPDALENIEIGSFTIEGLSRVPAGNQIVMNFKLDINGILQVTAKEKKTGLEKKITINNAISQFAGQKIIEAKQRIAGLFAATDEEIVVADNTDFATSVANEKTNKLINTAQQLLEKVNAEDREDLINLIDSIKDAIEGQEKAALQELTEKLSDMLFYLQAETV